MVDYFTNISVVLNLASEAEQAYALDLAHKASLAHQGDELPEDFPKALTHAIADWHFETVADGYGTKNGLWLHYMDDGVDEVHVFIQHLLQRFDPAGRVTFQWSHDCTKPRLDAYGFGDSGWSKEQIDYEEHRCQC